GGLYIRSLIATDQPVPGCPVRYAPRAGYKRALCKPRVPHTQPPARRPLCSCPATFGRRALNFVPPNTKANTAAKRRKAMNNFDHLQTILRELDKVEDSLRTLRDYVEPRTKTPINAAIAEAHRLRDLLGQVDKALELEVGGGRSSV